MSDDATSQVEAAKQHIEQAVRRLAALVNAVEEIKTAISAVDSTGMSAAGHLYRVSQVVGSQTAHDLADMTTEVVGTLRTEFAPSMAGAIDTCNASIERLNAVFEKAEQLAQQLGA